MLIRHRGHEPVVEPSAYIAPTATLVGQVRVGPRARVMYGAVLDAEDGAIEVGEASVICENAVLRGDVTLGDHVFVGPHATLLGCQVGRCAYLATGATVLQDAVLGAGVVIAIGATAHAGCVLPDEFFVPPNTVAIDGQVYAPGDPAMSEAISKLGFARRAFGVETAWESRIRRGEEMAEIRAAQFAAHVDDEIVG
ncbi:acyltransferase [Nonomuraea sp. NN258]|uniref:gamma carbonic anhydrase family protein n=1 Tax=Nonomuraea antri TaxID=2730852 RepID=UPI00156990FC|nr:acyltransferase [Nonomuraea antri]NRQ39623.1 acyltransferase [Nonomuraea antri]